MKRFFIAILIFMLCFFDCAIADTTFDTANQGIWKRIEYIDEFELGTGDYYIGINEAITGKFSNSATVDSRLDVMILTDREEFGFILYEYGNNKVVNPYSDPIEYRVTMLNSMREKTYWTGHMASGSDRILFNDEARIAIMQAMQTHPTLSFYIEEKGSPATNYLFTIQDTTGYEEAISFFYSDEYAVALQLFESGEYETACSLFASMREFADAEQKIVDCQNAILAQDYDNAMTLMNERRYPEAIAAFSIIADYSDSLQQIELCKSAALQYAEVLIEDYHFDSAAQLLRELEDCKGKSALQTKCHYQWAIHELNNGNNISAFYGFVNCGNYEDAEALAEEAIRECDPADIYTMGMAYYNWGNYQTALKYFERIPEYENTQQLIQYCEVMLDYQGSYKYTLLKSDKGWFLLLSGNKLMEYDFRDTVTDFSMNTVVLTEVNGKWALVDDIWADDTTGSHTYYYLSVDDKGNKCIEIDRFNRGRDMALYEESSYTVDSLNKKAFMAEDIPEPYIGMSVEQVLESAWGMPKHTALVENTGGIAECWTYPGKYYTDRIIYIENGIVVGFEE